MNAEQEIIYLTRVHALEHEIGRLTKMIGIMVIDVNRQMKEIARLKVASGESPATNQE